MAACHLLDRGERPLNSEGLERPRGLVPNRRRLVGETGHHDRYGERGVEFPGMSQKSHDGCFVRPTDSPLDLPERRLN